MKLTYNWSGSVFTAEDSIEKVLLEQLVDMLKASGYKINPPDGDERIPEYDGELGILSIPGE